MACSTCNPDPFAALANPLRAGGEAPTYRAPDEGELYTPDGWCWDGSRAKITTILRLDAADIGDYVVFCRSAPGFGDPDCEACKSLWSFYNAQYNGNVQATLNTIAVFISAQGFQATVMNGNEIWISGSYTLWTNDRPWLCDDMGKVAICGVDASNPDNLIVKPVDYEVIAQPYCDCPAKPEPPEIVTPQPPADPNFKICLNDCAPIKFYDTGDYPGFAYYNYQIKIIDIETDTLVFELSEWFFLYGSAQASAKNLPKLPDGVYFVTYNVYDLAGNLVKGSGRHFVVDCDVRCCYDKLDKANHATNCPSERQLAMVKVWTLLRSARESLMCTNNPKNALKILRTAQKICREVNCNCQ